MHVDMVQVYCYKKQYVLLCVMYTSREDQDNLQLSSEAGAISRDGQQPTNLKANPAYFSIKNSQQFTMSEDVVYSTIDEDGHQNILRDNPASFSLIKSVASLDKCRQKYNSVTCA